MDIRKICWLLITITDYKRDEVFGPRLSKIYVKSGELKETLDIPQSGT